MPTELRKTEFSIKNTAPQHDNSSAACSIQRRDPRANRGGRAREDHVIIFTFDPQREGRKMEALSAAYDSDASSGEETSQRKDELPPIDAEESSSVLSRLKERFPFNSAPAVPIPVRKHPMRVNWNRFPTCLSLCRKIRTTCCEWVQTQRKSRKIPQLSNSTHLR